jgi:hypothetical protein
MLLRWWTALSLALLTVRAVAQVPDTAGEWQVVLLKPRDCNGCVYVEEALKRSNQLRSVTLSDGSTNSVQATIERRTEAVLSASEYEQLSALPYYKSAQWSAQSQAGQLQVLLKQDGRIVSAGAIDDSADLRSREFPPELTIPEPGTSVETVRERYGQWFQNYFLREWNLDYFLRLARNPALAQSQSFDQWLMQQPAMAVASPVQQANAVLVATATGAADNELFNALRIEEIRSQLLTNVGLNASQLQVFYGAGNQPGVNAVEMRNGQRRFTRREVTGAQPARLQSLGALFDTLHQQQPGNRNLLVLVGHGGPDGTYLWGQPQGLKPDDLSALHRRGGGDNVLVSGNCYGGIMAQTTSCGFFGARPDIVATGCQADAAEVAQSKDYLHVFFGALDPAQRSTADSDGDGRVSFEEAHWEASLQGDARNITYTTVDALAEAYFKAHPEHLPTDISVGELLRLAEQAEPTERRAARELTRGVAGDHRISLRGLAAQGARWSVRPEGPRPMIGQLAQRLLYTVRFGSADSELVRARSCGARSVASFLSK